jgi:hypothetical protein
VFFLLLAITAVAHVNSGSDSLVQVAGQVISAETKEPLAKAQVTLGSRGAKDVFELIATTDETGFFRFADVSPGVYKLTADKTGFLSTGYGETKPDTWGDRLRDIILRLSPAGSISGQVIDPDGEPAPRYEVVLWARHWRTKGEPSRASDQATTDRRGEYHFDNVLPDSYFVSAAPEFPNGPIGFRQVAVDAEGRSTTLRELRTFYPSTLSLASSRTENSNWSGSGADRSGHPGAQGPVTARDRKNS